MRTLHLNNKIFLNIQIASNRTCFQSDKIKFSLKYHMRNLKIKLWLLNRGQLSQRNIESGGIIDWLIKLINLFKDHFSNPYNLLEDRSRLLCRLELFIFAGVMLPTILLQSEDCLSFFIRFCFSFWFICSRSFSFYGIYCI